MSFSVCVYHSVMLGLCVSQCNVRSVWVTVVTASCWVRVCHSVMLGLCASV